MSTIIAIVHFCSRFLLQEGMFQQTITTSSWIFFWVHLGKLRHFITHYYYYFFNFHCFLFRLSAGKESASIVEIQKKALVPAGGGGRKNSSIIQSISSSWRHKIHSTDATKESNKSSQTTMASTLDTYEGKLLNLTTTIHHDLYCTKRIKSKALRLLTAGCEAVMDAEILSFLVIFQRLENFFMHSHISLLILLLKAWFTWPMD